jgi:hypothetical protein
VLPRIGVYPTRKSTLRPIGSRTRQAIFVLRMNTYIADDRIYSPGALPLVAEEGLHEAQEVAVRKRRCAGIFMKPVILTHLHTCLLRLARWGNLLLPGGKAGASAAL